MVIFHSYVSLPEGRYHSRPFWEVKKRCTVLSRSRSTSPQVASRRLQPFFDPVNPVNIQPLSLVFWCSLFVNSPCYRSHHHSCQLNHHFFQQKSHHNCWLDTVKPWIYWFLHHNFWCLKPSLFGRLDQRLRLPGISCYGRSTGGHEYWPTIEHTQKDEADTWETHGSALENGMLTYVNQETWWFSQEKWWKMWI